MENNKVLSLVAWLLFAVVLSTGCDRAGQAASTAAQKTEDGVPVYDTNQAYPYEDFSDKAFYQHPRLQFVWDKRNDGLPELMSIRTDGTDLRKVIDSEKLFYDGATSFTHKPVRSPNRRYLAYTNSGDRDSTKSLIDLKTGEVTRLSTYLVQPQYFWSPDSENLFFHGDDMYRYHVPSKTLHKLPEFVYGAGFVVLPDNKTILAVTMEGVSYHDFDGKLLKSVDLGFKGKRGVDNNTLTADGKYLIIDDGNPSGLMIELTPAVKIVKEMKLPEFMFFGPIENINIPSLYITDSRGGLYQFELESERAILNCKIDGIKGYFSLMP